MSRLVLLKTEQDFQAFRKSRLYQSDSIRIRVHLGAHQNHPRFGFIVPKKSVPKAAHRNLLKRRIKAMLIKAIPKLKPVDILIFPQQRLMNKKFGDVEMVFFKLLTDAHLWKS